MRSGTGRPDRLEGDGYLVLENVIEEGQVSALIAASGNFTPASGDGVLHRAGAVYGVRDLLWRAPEIGLLARSPEVRSLVEPVLGPDAFPVRGLFFDKTPEANWNLPWHQDLTIAVCARHEVPGFGPWTVKAGITHALAPGELLSRMLTVRIHLDDCGPRNGPMRVLPGSHRAGRLSPAGLPAWITRADREAVDCLVSSGGAVLMRPLLVHASSSATANGHRRVIHLEFAAEELPADLAWYHPEQPLSNQAELT
jgi:ectoine hydroxylase-related dioxygenase (phytanoyl-CoA dioxygenase family)